ncbi:hypothetical protein S40293_07147 [Stachybotrys chartarum IBT 40293]|nr:hypothetical protein S40293_07147 [Stachybotrys chartarum IBT 40293]
MPTTRRSAASNRGRNAPTKGQSTISFAHRVTKNVSREKDLKKGSLSPALAKVEPVDDTQEIDHKVDDVVVDEPELKEEHESEPEEQLEAEKTEAEIKAEKIGESQINKYWKAIEAERLASGVHQKGLTVHEKVLRYFDVSSQYGPCIGISRQKRWERAEKLGLNPPVEVLSVLLMEDRAGNKALETAHMDQILNSMAVGA